jgi:hypothetical protein
MSKSEDERRARLAAALKQNISRRKAQTRARSMGEVKDQADSSENTVCEPAQEQEIEPESGR